MLATERRPCIRRNEEAKDALRFGHEQNGECNQMDGSMASDGRRLIAQYRKTATNFIDHDCSLSGDCCSKLDDSATPLPSPFKILVRMFEKNRINNHMVFNHQAHPNLHLHHGPSFHTYDEPDAEKNVVHQHASIIHHHHHHHDPTPHQQNLWASKMMMRKMLSSTDQSGFNFGRLIQHQHRCGRAKQISCLSNVLPNNDCYISCLFVLLVIMLFTPACFCIKVVSLNVPSHVRRGSDLELSCLFDLGNATLYSLKWFYRAHEWDREEQEFFRFTPRHKPYKQVFPLEGIQVDLSKSSGSVVYIRQANSKTSGKYKCEISVEETFQTVAAEKLMTVFNSSFSRLNGGLSWNDHLITICLAFIAYNVYNNLLLTHSHVI